MTGAEFDIGGVTGHDLPQIDGDNFGAGAILADPSDHRFLGQRQGRHAARHRNELGNGNGFHFDQFNRTRLVHLAEHVNHLNDPRLHVDDVVGRHLQNRRDTAAIHDIGYFDARRPELAIRRLSSLGQHQFTPVHGARNRHEPAHILRSAHHHHHFKQTSFALQLDGAGLIDGSGDSDRLAFVLDDLHRGLRLLYELFQSDGEGAFKGVDGEARALHLADHGELQFSRFAHSPGLADLVDMENLNADQVALADHLSAIGSWRRGGRGGGCAADRRSGSERGNGSVLGNRAGSRQRYQMSESKDLH